MNPDSFSNRPTMMASINTLSDLIQVLNIAKEKHGGDIKVRYVRESYHIGNDDEYSQIEDVVVSSNNSLLRSNSVRDGNYLVFVCE